MRKFNIVCISALAIYVLYLALSGISGIDLFLAWSILLNFLMVLILLNIFNAIKSSKLTLAPGFHEHYQKVISENLDLLDENTRLNAELEWIKAAPERPKYITVPKQEQNTGQFVSNNGMSTREKRVRAYVLCCDGKTDPEIAECIAVKASSVPAYRSEGRKIVKPYESIISGMPLERIVEFFCHADSTAAVN